MRSNTAPRVIHQPTRGRGHTSSSDGRSSRSVASDKQAGDDMAPRSKGERRALLYGLCPKAKLLVKEMDKGTRYEGKKKLVPHQLGEALFEGPLRPWRYYEHLKRCEGVEPQLKFSALGQRGFDQFFPLHNANDYTEAVALAQSQMDEVT